MSAHHLRSFWAMAIRQRLRAAGVAVEHDGYHLTASECGRSCSIDLAVEDGTVLVHLVAGDGDAADPTDVRETHEASNERDLASHILRLIRSE